MRKSHPVIKTLALVTVWFLYLPLLGVAVCSFNTAKDGWVWKGFTLDWYTKLFANERILNFAWNTLKLALVSTAIATVLGTVLAIGISRFPWGRKTNTLLNMMLNIQVVIPDIIMAGSLVVVFGLLREVSSIFDMGMIDMIIGHVTFQIAFVALVVRSRLTLIGQDVEEAGRDLFAGNWYLMRRVMLPLMMPGIVAGAMLAFTLSLDDFVISFFLSGSESQTLPLYIYAAVRRGVTPEIHALSTLVVMVTVILVVGSQLISKKEVA
jgi:spermidine/putrescine transport system permease protein